MGVFFVLNRYRCNESQTCFLPLIFRIETPDLSASRVFGIVVPRLGLSHGLDELKRMLPGRRPLSIRSKHDSRFGIRPEVDHGRTIPSLPLPSRADMVLRGV